MVAGELPLQEHDVAAQQLVAPEPEAAPHLGEVCSEFMDLGEQMAKDSCSDNPVWTRVFERADVVTLLRADKWMKSRTVSVISG